jgi:Txe/YoeB family toxin of Txe-Axe toxin-antitoxin module
MKRESILEANKEVYQLARDNMDYPELEGQMTTSEDYYSCLLFGSKHIFHIEMQDYPDTDGYDNSVTFLDVKSISGMKFIKNDKKHEKSCNRMIIFINNKSYEIYSSFEGLKEIEKRVLYFISKK